MCEMPQKYLVWATVGSAPGPALAGTCTPYLPTSVPMHQPGIFSGGMEEESVT